MGPGMSWTRLNGTRIDQETTYLQVFFKLSGLLYSNSCKNTGGEAVHAGTDARLPPPEGRGQFSAWTNYLYRHESKMSSATIIDLLRDFAAGIYQTGDIVSHVGIFDPAL